MKRTLPRTPSPEPQQKPDHQENNHQVGRSGPDVYEVWPFHNCEDPDPLFYEVFLPPSPPPTTLPCDDRGSRVLEQARWIIDPMIVPPPLSSPSLAPPTSRPRLTPLPLPSINTQTPTSIESGMTSVSQNRRLAPETASLTEEQRVPTNPRYKTKVACINCSRNKLGCDPGRPCRRCTATGKASTCVDRPKEQRRSRSRREDGRENRGLNAAG